MAGLSENRPLQRDLRAKASDGLVMWAECGGLLWLARSLDGHPLAGIVPAEGIMTDRLTLGYRTAELRVDSPLGPAGDTLRGHEFHYSSVSPSGSALTLRSRVGESLGGFRHRACSPPTSIFISAMTPVGRALRGSGQPAALSETEPLLQG